jgi:hypothetical protein
MAEIGLTTIGANAQHLWNGVACKFTPTEDGIITKLSGYVVTSGYLNGATMAIFSDNGTSPNVLRVTSTDRSGAYASQWQDWTSLTEEVAGGLEITNGVPIWIALRVISPGNDSGRSDTGGATDSFQEFSNPTYPTWANPPSVSGFLSNILSVNGTYTPSGGADETKFFFGVQ